VDLALAALAARGAAGSDAEFERIARRVAPAPRPGRAHLPVRALAFAAALVAVGGGALLALRGGPERPAWNGAKGAHATAAVPLRLRYLVVEGEGAGAALRRGASGEAVPAAAGLGFEVTLSRAAHVALVRVEPRGPPDAFWAGPLPAGSTLVSVSDRPAVYRLAGLSGRQRFVAVASEAPLDGAALARAVESAGAGVPGVAGADVLEVEIE
jgi:hypothetical protein